jgi:hypothetical protein
MCPVFIHSHPLGIVHFTSRLSDSDLNAFEMHLSGSAARPQPLCGLYAQVLTHCMVSNELHNLNEGGRRRCGASCAVPTDAISWCRASYCADGKGRALEPGIRHQVLCLQTHFRIGTVPVQWPLWWPHTVPPSSAPLLSCAAMRMTTAFFRTCECSLLHGSHALASKCVALQVRKVVPNNDKALVDPSGHPLPPCIVMERGESLAIWSAREKPDCIEAMTVRSLHLQLLACMHAPRHGTRVE